MISLVIHFGPGIKQHAGDLFMPFLRGNMQWSPTTSLAVPLLHQFGASPSTPPSPDPPSRGLPLRRSREVRFELSRAVEPNRNDRATRLAPSAFARRCPSSSGSLSPSGASPPYPRHS